MTDWWKPEPGDPYWMLENADGAWLQNEHSQLVTRESAKALRFPSEWFADCIRRSLSGMGWFNFMPTEHTWISDAPRYGIREALEQAIADLRAVGDDYPGSSCQQWCRERADLAERALRDSGSDAERGDANAAPSEGSQSGPAKTGHRPDTPSLPAQGNET